MVEHHFGTKPLGVLQKTLHEIRPLHAISIGWPVIDLSGRHELPALRHAGDKHRIEIGARCVDSGGVTRWA
jgi:hypothetical protein